MGEVPLYILDITSSSMAAGTQGPSQDHSQYRTLMGRPEARTSPPLDGSWSHPKAGLSWPSLPITLDIWRDRATLKVSYRGTSHIRKHPPPRTTTGPYAQGYRRVLGGSVVL